MEDKELFKYKDSYNNNHEIELVDDDFKFVQKDKKLHDVKLKGRPTTFFKDSMKRFVKSKSSVVASVVLGTLVVLGLVLPWAIPSVGASDVYNYHVSSNYDGIGGEQKVVPKLFNAGTGFWDGTIDKKDIIFDQNKKLPVGYDNPKAIINLKTYETFGDSISQYGTGGYLVIGGEIASKNDNLYVDTYQYSSYEYDFDLTNTYSLTLNLMNPSLEGYAKNPEFRVSLLVNDNNVSKLYPLTNNEGLTSSINFGTNQGFITYKDETPISINVNEELKQLGVTEKLEKASILIDVKRSSDVNAKSGLFIKSLNASTSNKEDLEFPKRSIIDANNNLMQPQKVSPNGITKVDNTAYWRAYGTTKVSPNDIKIVYANFKYDQYEATYGNKEITLSSFNVNDYIVNGWMKYTGGKATNDKAILKSRFTILDEKCPIVEITEQIGDTKFDLATGQMKNYSLKAVVSQYKIRGYSKMPVFLFGTDANGRDFLKLIFTGLVLSLILGLIVASINVVIGLIWGSISGYFGGWTDIVMERFCDIVAGMPSVAVITLALIYSDNDILAFLIALFMTGWMGVSGRTRTQFYRFKGREYVLASRTLGAKDGRLIFRHILPNSLGTIITSSVLLVPGVISSEASIAYLGLGLQNQILFGVILSENRSHFMGESTYLLIIPTVIFALLLISFNLFGNGLRDAFNPSLKGEE